MDLREQLKRDEGTRLQPYKDSLGFLTIGTGHCLDKKGISQAASDFILDEDIAASDAELEKYLPWTLELDDARKGVFRNMCFNLGVHGLMGFRNALTLAQQGKFPEASAELLNSHWAEQVGARAQRLAKQLEEGIWV